MNQFIVYVHTNKIDGKRYVGITRQTAERRWGHGSGYSRNPKFYHAIQKYGWDNFTHEVVLSGLTQEEAEQEEVRLIKELKTSDREFGYNLDNGGRGPKRYTEELKQKISESGKKRFQRPEERLKSSLSARRRNQDEEKFKRICEGNRKRWLREEEHQKISDGLSDYYSNNPERKTQISEERRRFFAEHPEKKPSKKVVQITTEGEIVKVWESLTLASETLNINIQNISAVCRHKRATTGGYKWEFAK